MAIVEHRLETLLLSRASALRGAASASDLVEGLARYCPADRTAGAWTEELARAIERLRGTLLSDDHRLADREELKRRLGGSPGATWQQLADRILPGIALGVAPGDKALAKLSSRDAWAAAIVSRARGLWSDGAPPSLAAVCDAIAWQHLGLSGKAKRLPAEVRSLFLQQELGTTAAAPDRLLRQLAARELGVPRADARALRDGLVRAWLAGRTLGRTPPRSFAEQVHTVARSTRDGVFGDRKVFISSVWDELRRSPAWSTVTLDEFKAQLVAAHRAGDLVLARADLVAAMNPALVAASETLTEGASFHFIVREPA